MFGFIGDWLQERRAKKELMKMFGASTTQQLNTKMNESYESRYGINSHQAVSDRMTSRGVDNASIRSSTQYSGPNRG